MRPALLLFVAAFLLVAVVFFSQPARPAEPLPHTNLELVTTDPASVRAFLESLGFEMYSGMSSREGNYGKEGCNNSSSFLGVFSHPKTAAPTSGLMVCVAPTLPTRAKARGFCQLAQAITGRPYTMRMEPGSARVTCIPGTDA